MILDLADKEIRVRLAPVSGGCVRLTLDYPNEPHYRDRVMQALSDLLRPPSTNKAKTAKSRKRRKDAETDGQNRI